MRRRLDRRWGSRAARLVALAHNGAEARERARVSRRLRLRLGAPVEVEVTDNTYTMISFTRRRGGYGVRLHHMFLGAPDDILERLAAYVRGHDRQASAVLDDYIHEHRRLIRHVSPVKRQERLELSTRGRVHDLAKLLGRASFQYRRMFGLEARDVAIAWAPAPKVRLPRRSIKLGSYSADTQIIRIHPALDQPAVPAYFVEWIVFHELLHHRFRADLKARNGRIHTPHFCRLEQQYPFYFPAMAWERQNLDLLLWWFPGEGVKLKAG